MTKPTAEQIEWAIESANNVRHTNSEEWLLSAYLEAIEALRAHVFMADAPVAIEEMCNAVLAKAPKEDE